MYSHDLRMCVQRREKTGPFWKKLYDLEDRVAKVEEKHVELHNSPSSIIQVVVKVTRRRRSPPDQQVSLFY